MSMFKYSSVIIGSSSQMTAHGTFIVCLYWGTNETLRVSGIHAVF